MFFIEEHAGPSGTHLATLEMSVVSPLDPVACPICHIDLSMASAEEVIAAILNVKCPRTSTSIHHRSCLKSYLEHAGEKGYEALCPVCKKAIDKLVSDELSMSRFRYLTRTGVAEEFKSLIKEASEEDLLTAPYHTIRYNRVDTYLRLMSTAKEKHLDAINRH